MLFAGVWHLDGLLLHEGCRGLGEGAVSGVHEEIEGACAAGSGSMIEEAGGVDGEDGPGSAPSGPVAGVLAVSEAASDGFEGQAAEGVEFLPGPSSWHGVALQAVWGREKWARVRRFGGVSGFRFPFTPGGFRPETVRGLRRAGIPARSARPVRRGRVRAGDCRRSRRACERRCGSGGGRGAFRPR